MKPQISRRVFIESVGAVSLASLSEMRGAKADALTSGAPAGHSGDGVLKSESAAPNKPVYRFFNPEQARFIEAACERLIPADEVGPGALEAGVPNYLDTQLNGAWGAGERLYRSGPWLKGTASQGYQLPFTPAELFHAALQAIQQEFGKREQPFSELPPEAQDAYLKSLEEGAQDLGGVPAHVFFDMLLKMTIEGFFADPVYGGNRNMNAWRMIGFPGAYADYYEAIDRHGVRYDREPMSIGEDGHRHLHPDPNIPAHL